MINNSNLAVCSWSLRPTDPLNLVNQLQAIGINRTQIALDPLREQSAVWDSLAEVCAKNGVSFVSGMFGTLGEDYSTLETIKRTGGIVPDATWEQNWRNIETVAGTAKKLGLKLVTFHVGFLPHEASDPAFKELLQRITRIA